jgi:hypothetical protein
MIWLYLTGVVQILGFGFMFTRLAYSDAKIGLGPPSRPTVRRRLPSRELLREIA